MYVADRRAEFARDRDRADRPASVLAWEFAEGEFDLRVYAGRGEEPSDAQAKAFTAFRANDHACAAELIQTIFEQYLDARDVRRQNWQDPYRDDVLPELADPTGLRDLIQLRHIHVHPVDNTGHVTIALQFVAVYDYAGITALWRDGRFERWGQWGDARPKNAT
jgi:hypothetical protein